MIPMEVLAELAQETPSKIVLFVMDGLGGLPDPQTGKTELETAKTPNLDRLAAESICGMSQPVGMGITPGSGPAHLALFGYDPIRCNVGRGILSALGVNFPVDPQDVAARINFATVDQQGRVVDRRAGRISTEKNRELMDLLRGIKVPGVEIFLETESGHRGLAVFRGPGLSDQLSDTDPQATGVPPHPVTALTPEAEPTARLVRQFLDEALRVLAPHHPANAILLRGFAKHPDLATLRQLYKLRTAAVATYPMYRGLGRLVGMTVLETGTTLADEIATIRDHWNEFDYFFLHYKSTDTTGEDGNFPGKVAVIEEVDAQIPALRALNPDVLSVTGDHSTPSRLKMHSWHPVPFMLSSAWCFPDDVAQFNERACSHGALGRFAAREAMALMLANGLKLQKYGA